MESAALHKQLRCARFAAKLSQRELAKKVGVHENYIGHLECGRRSPSLKVLHDIAEALGCQVTINIRTKKRPRECGGLTVREEEEIIIKMWRRGRSVSAIAAALDWSREDVVEVLRRFCPARPTDGEEG